MEVIGTETEKEACGGICACRFVYLLLLLLLELSKGPAVTPGPGWDPIFEAPELFLASGPWKQVWSRLEGHAWNVFKACCECLFRT